MEWTKEELQKELDKIESRGYLDDWSYVIFGVAAKLDDPELRHRIEVLAQYPYNEWG